MTPRSLALALCLALAAPHAMGAAAPEVLCSTTLVGNVVRAVAGSALEVEVLLPPNADPHALQPTPTHALASETADPLVLSGAGLGTSLLPRLAAARGRAVDPSSEVKLGADEEHGVDPHLWLDPRNVLAEQVARDTGARIVFLYTGSLSEPGGPADNYVRLMRYNVEQLISALVPPP